VEGRIKNILVDDLLEKGITHSRDGIPVQDLNLRQLKEVAALASFREIDVENSNNVWF